MRAQEILNRIAARKAEYHATTRQLFERLFHGRDAARGDGPFWTIDDAGEGGEPNIEDIQVQLLATPAEANAQPTRVLTLSPDEALALADWFYDMLGEPQEELAAPEPEPAAPPPAHQKKARGKGKRR